MKWQRTWKRGRVITLSNLILRPLILNRRKRRPGSNQRLAFRPFEDVRRLRLVQFRRIRQRKDDGSVDVLGHFSDHVLGEGARLRRGSDQDVRSYLFDHFEQVVVSLARPF